MLRAQLRIWPWRVSIRDEGFHQEVLSAAIRGMRVLACLEAAVAVVAFTGELRSPAIFGLLLLAVATGAIARMTAVYPHARLLAAISAAAAGAIVVRSLHAHATASSVSADYALGAVTSIFLVTAAVIPLLPVQTLCIGISVAVAGFDSGHPLFLIMLAAIATAISATLMELRTSQYKLYLDTLRSLGELRDSQSKAMREKSSETMVRMTAALAHELSSPIGALSCGIETLLRLGGKYAVEAPGFGHQQLEGILLALSGSMRDSIVRLRMTVNRIQKLTSLDNAVAQETNLNELTVEAVGLMRSHSPEGARFNLDFQPLPDVICKREQIVSVICSVLANSFAALGGDGRISVSTGLRDSRLELRIEDNGCGIPAARLAHIFDPRFQVADGRVSTGNWSLFASRQYMMENGGDIRIESMEGKGTTVWLTLHVAS